MIIIISDEMIQHISDSTINYFFGFYSITISDNFKKWKKWVSAEIILSNERISEIICNIKTTMYTFRYVKFSSNSTNNIDWCKNLLKIFVEFFAFFANFCV